MSSCGCLRRTGGTGGGGGGGTAGATGAVPAKGDAQDMQNREPSGFSAPQLEHFVDLTFCEVKAERPS